MKILKKFEEIGFAMVPNDRTQSQFFHVSFIFQKNKIYSIGVNSFKTHTRAKQLGYKGNAIHAELSSVLKFGLEDCSRYNIAVLRISRENKLAMSKPCYHCNKLIETLNFKRVFYTNKFGNWEQK